MIMEKIGIQKLLSQWDMEVFKDHAGKYYVFHDGCEDFFHGKILTYDSARMIPDCISDSLLEEELRDLGDEIHYDVNDLEEAKKVLMEALTEDKEIPDFLRFRFEAKLSIIDGLMGEVIDDVPANKTNLIFAVNEALNQGIFKVEFSENITDLGCSGVYCHAQSGTLFQDDFYFNRYGSEAKSMEQFIKNVETSSSRYDHWYSGRFFSSDYDEGGYEQLEMARDIAATIMDMTQDEFDCEEAHGLLLVLRGTLPGYYKDVIDKEIEKAVETAKESEKEN